MSDKPKLSSVAKEAGVSVPTVSQVLRGTGRISEETRRKVHEAARKLRYVPDSRAAAMRSGENREIGFIINQLGNPFNAEVVSGVVDLLESEGYLVSIVDTRDDQIRQQRLIETFIRHGRGGLIWVPAIDTPADTFELLAARGIPVVTFLRQVPGILDHVGIRNADATATATKYLAELGHVNIAYLGGTDMTPVRSERIEGYERVRSQRNLGPAIIWDCQDNKLDGLQAMLDLRIAHPEVTALVCNGDMVALGACLALTRLGLSPGRDMSVIGFDDIQDAAVATPQLTTLAVQPRELGRQLASILLSRIKNSDLPPTVAEVAADLVIRETAAPPPQSVGNL